MCSVYFNIPTTPFHNFNFNLTNRRYPPEIRIPSDKYKIEHTVYVYIGNISTRWQNYKILVPLQKSKT